MAAVATATAVLDKHTGQTGKFAYEKWHVKWNKCNSIALRLPFVHCSFIVYNDKWIKIEVSIIAMQYGSSVSNQLRAAVAAARKRRKNALKVNV